jgi:hypothetical protein
MRRAYTAGSTALTETLKALGCSVIFPPAVSQLLGNHLAKANLEPKRFRGWLKLLVFLGYQKAVRHGKHYLKLRFNNSADAVTIGV